MLYYVIESKSDLASETCGRSCGTIYVLVLQMIYATRAYVKLRYKLILCTQERRLPAIRCVCRRFLFQNVPKNGRNWRSRLEKHTSSLLGTIAAQSTPHWGGAVNHDELGFEFDTLDFSISQG